MKLESQVASLELCKKLKELGVKQGESLFAYWTDCTLPFEDIWENRKWEFLLGYKYQLIDNGCSLRNTIDAFTVAELIESLPLDLPGYDGYRLYIMGNRVMYMNRKFQWTEFNFIEHVLAESLSKMLIHLIERGIVKVEGA